MKRRVWGGVLLCLKILLPILIVIPLAFFSWRLVETRLEDLANMGNDGYHSGTGLYLFASHILLLGANAVLTAVGCIGLLIAQKHKTSPRQKQNVKAFRCLAIAPAISQVIYVAVNAIVMAIK